MSRGPYHRNDPQHPGAHSGDENWSANGFPDKPAQTALSVFIPDVKDNAAAACTQALSEWLIAEHWQQVLQAVASTYNDVAPADGASPISPAAIDDNETTSALPSSRSVVCGGGSRALTEHTRRAQAFSLEAITYARRTLFIPLIVDTAELIDSYPSLADWLLAKPPSAANAWLRHVICSLLESPLQAWLRERYDPPLSLSLGEGRVLVRLRLDGFPFPPVARPSLSRGPHMTAMTLHVVAVAPPLPLHWRTAHRWQRHPATADKRVDDFVGTGGTSRQGACGVGIVESRYQLVSAVPTQLAQSSGFDKDYARSARRLHLLLQDDHVDALRPGDDVYVVGWLAYAPPIDCIPGHAVEGYFAHCSAAYIAAAHAAASGLGAGGGVGSAGAGAGGGIYGRAAAGVATSTGVAMSTGVTLAPQPATSLWVDVVSLSLTAFEAHGLDTALDEPSTAVSSLSDPYIPHPSVRHPASHPSGVGRMTAILHGLTASIRRTTMLSTATGSTSTILPSVTPHLSTTSSLLPPLLRDPLQAFLPDPSREREGLHYQVWSSTLTLLSQLTGGLTGASLSAGASLGGDGSGEGGGGWGGGAVGGRALLPPGSECTKLKLCLLLALVSAQSSVVVDETRAAVAEARAAVAAQARVRARARARTQIIREQGKGKWHGDVDDDIASFFSDADENDSLITTVAVDTSGSDDVDVDVDVDDASSVINPSLSHLSLCVVNSGDCPQRARLVQLLCSLHPRASVLGAQVIAAAAPALARQPAPLVLPQLTGQGMGGSGSGVPAGAGLGGGAGADAGAYSGDAIVRHAEGLVLIAPCRPFLPSDRAVVNALLAPLDAPLGGAVRAARTRDRVRKSAHGYEQGTHRYPSRGPGGYGGASENDEEDNRHGASSIGGDGVDVDAAGGDVVAAGTGGGGGAGVTSERVGPSRAVVAIFPCAPAPGPTAGSGGRQAGGRGGTATGATSSATSSSSSLGTVTTAPDADTLARFDLAVGLVDGRSDSLDRLVTASVLGLPLAAAHARGVEGLLMGTGEVTSGSGGHGDVSLIDVDVLVETLAEADVLAFARTLAGPGPCPSPSSSPSNPTSSSPCPAWTSTTIPPVAAHELTDDDVDVLLAEARSLRRVELDALSLQALQRRVAAARMLSVALAPEAQAFAQAFYLAARRPCRPPAAWGSGVTRSGFGEWAADGGELCDGAGGGGGVAAYGPRQFHALVKVALNHARLHMRSTALVADVLVAIMLLEETQAVHLCPLLPFPRRIGQPLQKASSIADAIVRGSDAAVGVATTQLGFRCQQDDLLHMNLAYGQQGGSPRDTFQAFHARVLAFIAG